LAGRAARQVDVPEFVLGKTLAPLCSSRLANEEATCFVDDYKFRHFNCVNIERGPQAGAIAPRARRGAAASKLGKFGLDAWSKDVCDGQVFSLAFFDQHCSQELRQDAVVEERLLPSFGSPNPRWPP
jgi:hypothetical protein